MKRGAEVAKISLTETDQGFAMNEICQKRFLSFCRAYLNRDKNYIDQLRCAYAMSTAWWSALVSFSSLPFIARATSASSATTS